MFVLPNWRVKWLSVIFITLSLPAFAKQNETAAKLALDLCQTTPTDIEMTRTTLRDTGWETSKESAMKALVNAHLTSAFRDDDLKYTFENAGFIAASILSNSALGGDQISMTFGDFDLAFLGINEGKPYCVMSGPSRLMDLLYQTKAYEELAVQSSGILQQSMGFYSMHKVAVIGRFDTAKRDKLLTTIGLTDEELSELKLFLAPATLIISTSEIVP